MLPVTLHTDNATSSAVHASRNAISETFEAICSGDRVGRLSPVSAD